MKPDNNSNTYSTPEPAPSVSPSQMLQQVQPQRLEQQIIPMVLVGFVTSAAVTFLISFVVGLFDPSPRGFFGTSYSTTDYLLYPVITATVAIPLHCLVAVVLIIFGLTAVSLSKTQQMYAILIGILLMIIAVAVSLLAPNLLSVLGMQKSLAPLAYITSVSSVIAYWLWLAYYKGAWDRIKAFYS